MCTEGEARYLKMRLCDNVVLLCITCIVDPVSSNLLTFYR